MEGSGEQGGRVNVRGWQLHRGSLIENNTAKSQLEWILFKFTLPLAISPRLQGGQKGDCNNRDGGLFYYLLHHRPIFTAHTMIADTI